MMAVAEAEVALSHGYWHQGTCHRQAHVRGLADCGLLLGEALSALPFPVERATLLLSHCVTQLGEVKDVQLSTVRGLSMGDREVLLLHVQRLTFGERMECVLRCTACGELLDLELRVSELLAPVADNSKQLHTEFFSADDGRRFRIRFRVPTGADVEAAIGASHCVLEKAVPDLLARCLDCVEREDAPEEYQTISLQDCQPALMDEISARLAEIDAQAEIALQAICPICQEEFQSILDVTDFLLREIEARERQLYSNVHRLALAYHWSEKEILEMSPRKRKMYLDMLDREHL